MTHKIVYNRCYGGFSISKEALLKCRELSNNDPIFGPGNWDNTLPDEFYQNGSQNKNYGRFYDSYLREIPRHHPILVKVVEELKDKANGQRAKLDIETLNQPYYRISEYDGMEEVIDMSPQTQ